MNARLLIRSFLAPPAIVVQPAAVVQMADDRNRAARQNRPA
jgi:hypothetical protein